MNITGKGGNKSTKSEYETMTEDIEDICFFQ